MVLVHCHNSSHIFPVPELRVCNFYLLGGDEEIINPSVDPLANISVAFHILSDTIRLGAMKRDAEATHITRVR